MNSDPLSVRRQVGAPRSAQPFSRVDGCASCSPGSPLLSRRPVRPLVALSRAFERKSPKGTPRVPHQRLRVPLGSCAG